MAALLLASACESYSLNTVPRVGALALSPQMMCRYNPSFGDNTYERKADLNSVEGAVSSDGSSEWYYPEAFDAADQMEPQFGDNAYSRRSQLSSAHDGVVVPTGQANSEWYSPESFGAADQFEPQFGDNTYSRRSSLNKPAA